MEDWTRENEKIDAEFDGQEKQDDGGMEGGMDGMDGEDGEDKKPEVKETVLPPERKTKEEKEKEKLERNPKPEFPEIEIVVPEAFNEKLFLETFDANNPDYEVIMLYYYLLVVILSDFTYVHYF